MWNAISGLGLVMGGILFYFGTPHQQLDRTIAPKRSLRWGGLVLLIVATTLLATRMAVSAAIFSATIVVMTIWSLAPLLIAWLRHRREGHA